MKTGVMMLWCAWVLWSEIQAIPGGSSGWYVWQGYDDYVLCRKIAEEYREGLLAKGPEKYRQQGQMTVSRDSGGEVRQKFVCLPGGTDPRESRR